MNLVTEPDFFPRIDDLLDKVGKTRFLTKLDMAKGYHQVKCDDESIAVTGFVTPFGFSVGVICMPFSFQNAPATFNWLVCKLVLGCESFCLVYLDDILVFSETWSDHVKHLRTIFERVRNASLTLKRNKCELSAAELHYLGYHIYLGSMFPREQKVRALVDFSRPTNRKGVQRFLGLAVYFRRFISHYPESTCSLTELLKKNSKFVWTEN